MKRYGAYALFKPRPVARSSNILCFHQRASVQHVAPNQHTRFMRSLRTRHWHEHPQRRMMASDPQSSASGEELHSQVRYLPIEEVEPFERYDSVGYYPVRIGDKLSSYQIVHKLGFGSSSTIWLAWDEKNARYVAIKIARADIKQTTEMEILRTLLDTPSERDAFPGRSAILPLLDTFEVTGPEIRGHRGLHTCMVTPLTRMSVSDAREASYKRIFELDVARAIAVQLIHAVAFLHSRGVVHADLHEGNIMVRLPEKVNTMTLEQLYDTYGKPQVEPVTRLDGQPLDSWVPDHGIVPVWLGDACEDVTLAESAILLIDFGESFRPEISPRYESHTPYVLRAPEILLHASTPISYPADIWALACSVFSILGQGPLFDHWFPSGDQILQEHVDALGQMPPQLWASWDSRVEFFGDDLKRTDGEPHRTLAARFEYSIQEPRRYYGEREMAGEEKTALLALLKSMLAFIPEDRPSIEQVLRSEWVTRWAEPALSKARNTSK